MKINCLEDYQKAQKLGMKELPLAMNITEAMNLPNKGINMNSYLPVLDEILKTAEVEGEEKLGIQEIPLDLVVGTKTLGRTTAFAPNFMPLLDADTEFGNKWISLCQSHLEEGIRDPILCYEYLNKYYVQEGNKRVSVLKYFNAPQVTANVTRIIPKKTNDPEIVIYYEYMNFHRYSHICNVIFSKEGSYHRLLELIGKAEHEEWTDDEQLNFKSVFNRFSVAFSAMHRTSKLDITVGDAFLAFLTVYGYEDIQDKLPKEFSEDIPKIWEEFLLLMEPNNDSVELSLDPVVSSEPMMSAYLNRIFTPAKKKIGFVHNKTAATSSWTYSHELGRMYLEQTFPDEIETMMVDNVEAENADEVMEDLIRKGCTILFTTTPNFVEASLKVAVEHPDVKVLNCSLNMSHRYIRTYYARMYEAKFISGAIAGALTDTDHIGYIASYPIYGMTANINAFALGAKMTNPRAVVHLAWSCLKDKDIYQAFRDQNISHISEQDMITPAGHSKAYGLVRFDENGELKTLATTLWDWGKIYEPIVRNILNGAWKKDSPTDGTKALNYWWGMSSDVIDVVLSRELSPDTRRLVRLLKDAIRKGDFNPFSGMLYDQKGNVVSDSEECILTPEDIISMNWLNDNIIGSIPKKEDLQEETRKLITLQGIIE